MHYTVNNTSRIRKLRHLPETRRILSAGRGERLRPRTSPRSAERRQFERFRVKGVLQVYFEAPRRIPLSGIRKIRFGPVANISLSGMAVDYIANRRRIEDYQTLTIEIPGRLVLLERVMYSTRIDYTVAKLANGQEIRRRCIRFERLNQHQVHHLRRFIKTEMCGRVRDRRSGLDRRYPKKADDPFIALSGWENDKGRRRKPERRRLVS